LTRRTPNDDGNITGDLSNALVYPTVTDLMRDLRDGIHRGDNHLDLHKNKYVLWTIAYDEDRHRMGLRELWQLNSPDDAMNLATNMATVM
jgi:hypothetical protein